MLLENHDRITSYLVREEYAEVPTSFTAEYESLRKSLSHTDSVRSLTKEASQVAEEFLREIAAGPCRAMGALFGAPD